MHEPTSAVSAVPQAHLAHIIGVDHHGQVWIRSQSSARREIAWLSTTIDGPALEHAMTHKHMALVQRVAPDDTAIICALVRPQLAPQPQRDTPVEAAKVVHADAIELGGGRARLSLRGKTLMIEAESIVSYARGRHRLLGGSLELG